MKMKGEGGVMCRANNTPQQTSKSMLKKRQLGYMHDRVESEEKRRVEGGDGSGTDGKRQRCDEKTCRRRGNTEKRRAALLVSVWRHTESERRCTSELLN